MKFSRADHEKIKELASKHNLPMEMIEGIVMAPYEFIQEESKRIEFKDGMTRSEFDELKTNFNIPSLGKLYASHFMYKEIQNKKKKKLG
tara:strand:- start:574 stop:840 length:267 start_codon:yes stop_codon:yes gene_type:complete